MCLSHTRLVMTRNEKGWCVAFQVGLVIATGAEPSFHLLGFAVTVAATALRALKTVMQVL